MLRTKSVKTDEQRAQAKRELSWILYDCGNSAYSMAITTALFPLYFSMISGGNGMDIGYYNSFASIVIAIISPILGTYADYKDKKKRFFIFFSIMSLLATMLLAVVPGDQMFAVGVIFIVSSIGYAAANTFYDAFLVDTTSDERMDLVSSLGFAYGYIASIIPFAISLGVIYWIGMKATLGFQISFLITAVWWGLLTIPLLKNVHQRYYIEPEPKPVRATFKRFFATFKNIKQHKTIFLFLIAYFLYIDGVDTIIKMVVPYANGVVPGLSDDPMMLLVILLVVQIIAFPFAIIYGKLAKRFSTMNLVRFAIIVYLCSTIYGTMMTTMRDVIVLSVLIGSAQGGIQALSRSYFARIIPKENSNEFFGFYNIFGKFAAILGPLIMSLITTHTGSIRYSLLGIIPLFVIGFALTLLLPTDSVKRSKAQH